MTIRALQIRDLIIQPCLKELNMWSPMAEILVWGTGAWEGDSYSAIKQYGKGPALSWFGIEPNTYNDLLTNTIRGLSSSVQAALMGMVPKKYSGWPPAEYLAHNPYFACAICRLLYYRVPRPIPQDLEGCARYWKQWYNTPLGAGTPEVWLARYNMVCN